MRKFAVPVLTLLIFQFFTADARAALITVDTEGYISWNVLGATNIQHVKSYSGGDASEVLLTYSNDHISLDFGDEDKRTTLDITDYQDEIVKIEKVIEPETVSIEASDEGFYIKQRGITAKTVYPLKISEEQGYLSVQTESGERFIVVLPYEAMTQVVRSKIVSDLGEDGKVELIERNEGELAYKITGHKNFNIFNFIDVPVEVNTYVSALSGNVLEIDQPVWSRVLNFLLT